MEDSRTASTIILLLLNRQRVAHYEQKQKMIIEKEIDVNSYLAYARTIASQYDVSLILMVFQK